MGTRLLAIDGPLARSVYAEREIGRRSALDTIALALLVRLRLRWAPPAAVALRRLAAAGDERRALSSRSNGQLRSELKAAAGAAVQGLRRRDLHAALLRAAEMTRRALAMEPYPTQLLGAMTLLRGQLAEMQTGEGKTLTAGLAACVAAAAGLPVHVVTVNDYLARRDAAKLQPLFALAGLTVGVAVEGMDAAAKRRAYACDIVYCTNKELVFDYLRDRVAVGGRCSSAQMGARSYFAGATAGPTLRGLHFAIVDEADSVLIDEARTPLILAEATSATADLAPLELALRVASGMRAGRDYVVDPSCRDLRLTPRGQDRVTAATQEECAAAWRAAHGREHLVTQALRAIHLHVRDQHYLVDGDGKVQIIDEYTGRVLPGRVWEHGLHQLVEAKERLALSAGTQTLARITYQRFFPRYLRLSGMTGTARETANELDAVYGLRTVTIPTHRRSARRRLPDVACLDQSEKWQAVAAQVAAWHRQGRPVLVGTRSVAASEQISRVLAGHGLTHAVLNARQDRDEAEVVAAAGRADAITVATNMAGRGTDIELGPGVAERGGLAVILTDYHESPRIDRQLIGRCARQGDPGTAVAIVALDDALLTRHGGIAATLLRRLVARTRRCPAFLMRSCIRRAQHRAEHGHAGTRSATLRRDQDIDRLLAFSGDPL